MKSCACTVIKKISMQLPENVEPMHMRNNPIVTQKKSSIVIPENVWGH